MPVMAKLTFHRSFRNNSNILIFFENEKEQHLFEIEIIKHTNATWAYLHENHASTSEVRLWAVKNHLEPLVYFRTDTGNSLTTGTFSSQACEQTLTHTAKTMGHFCAWETTLCVRHYTTTNNISPSPEQWAMGSFNDALHQSYRHI